MNAHRCCHHVAAQHPGPRSLTPLQRFYLAVKWAAPGAILMVMPKCPMCIVAYVALFTGMGISLSTAAHLRMLVLILCLISILFLAAKSAAGRRRVVSPRF
ncbi:hypothetical protein CfE428DRAFT_5964 [Chthoniobacter flavus Ellin428]|uniref:Uncharacterized protein n=1 Tax=Chthoniobacter flavus Ellin428 TaxID=497964 RepID=B4DAM3_9BACT|nr:hypothetical protein [Chthoniobacter flavus]EDY16541.1 hypothetical protein CfE428DRAFT_5964 [Chthoniobacter flavus Ellin428]TCO85203.1 hypothetical protein EV701_1322 [Chthoniobacter flavus]